MAKDTGGYNEKYDLDSVAERRGVPGKTAKLADLVKKYGGFDKIDPNDPDFREYLRGDVMAAKHLLDVLPNSPTNKGEGWQYARREHRVASLNGRMTLNGFRVDLPLLEQRIAQGEEQKKHALTALRDDFDLPLGRIAWKGRGDKKEEFWEEFASPLSTLNGRKWLAEVWAAFGVLNPPLTEKGQLSTKAEDLRVFVDSPITNPELREILRLMTIVTTIRTVYQTVADHLVGDRVHPLISMRQSSGRSSVTAPGLTVFGKRGGRHRERDIFLPEEGHVLVSADLSQVDMRGVAGLCQDPAYMALFEPGRDVHDENALLIFGGELGPNGHHPRRDEIKPINHGSNYGLGKKKMIASGHNPKVVNDFFAMQQREFPELMAWKDRVREIAASGQFLDNGFGRKMRPDSTRAYTQGPALMGQGSAADIMKEALLRLSEEFRPYERVMVHDEEVFSFPADQAEEMIDVVKDAFTFDFEGVPIECDVSPLGKNWGEVSAK
jgi:DNA polymerase-1